MKIKLNWLKLRNFKGAKKLEVIADGENLNIYGDNGTGKTTVADAENWLLFDKDSQGKSTFDIKTLDENNEPIHHLEHEVEGCYDIDGKELILKKTYYEKYQTKRGSGEKTFTGHTTDHEINEVPKAAGEYKEYISTIINEDTFKLLTNPTYFNEQLKWEDRRNILIEVCGSVSEEDVIDSDKKLAGLKKIISDRTLEEHKTVIKSKMSKINKKIKDIPTRIDEVDRGLPDIAGIDVDKVEADIKAVKAKKSAKEKELAKVESGGGVAEKEKKLAELQTQLIKIEQEHRKVYEEESKEIKRVLFEKEEVLENAKIEVRNHEKAISSIKGDIENIEKTKEKLRGEWYDLESKKKELMAEEWEGESNCYACGQELPEEQIEEAMKKFNNNKAEKIAKLFEEQKEINEKGQALNEDTKDSNSDINTNRKAIYILNESIEKLTNTVKELDSDIGELKEKAEAYQEDFQYKKKLAEAEGIETSIRKLKVGNHEEMIKIQDSIYKLEDEIKGLEIKLNSVDDYNKKQERIKELTAQQKKLAAEYEKLEGEAFLVEEFERKQASMLEDKINGEFEIARFKLFDKQVNGGISQTCETIVEGVPYSTGLNSGAKTNAGIDIINKLSEHYDFYAPIFVDNSESVTRILPSKSQMIKLVVSGKDKKLRIEKEGA